MLQGNGKIGPNPENTAEYIAYLMGLPPEVRLPLACGEERSIQYTQFSEILSRLVKNGLISQETSEEGLAYYLDRNFKMGIAEKLGKERLDPAVLSAVASANIKPDSPPSIIEYADKTPIPLQVARKFAASEIRKGAKILIPEPIEPGREPHHPSEIQSGDGNEPKTAAEVCVQGG
ncbi:MAG: hypothetical protein PHH26_00385 [Candidatus Thermoplasmatota archaeon]|nr:hypothetical protein [Candidatus Thermoplasmatota archaeon]